MNTTEHVHEIAWAFEGPLWFCACGAEFYPVKPTTSRSIGKLRPHRSRIRLSAFRKGHA